MLTSFIVSGIIILCCTILPLIRQDYWTFRIFDYPRIQKLILTLTWIAFLLAFEGYKSTVLLTFSVIMLLNAIYLFYLIYPFTTLAPKQVQNTSSTQEKDNIRVLISNVYEDNDDIKGCLEVVYRSDADLVLLLETDEKWARGLSCLDEKYAYQVKVPLNNTYGMLLFSKYKLQQINIRYLVEADIPSISCHLELPSGQNIQIFAVHPTPPVPNENPRSTERDKELLLIAKEAKESKLPVLVMGDLNDVAWSYTTTLFLKMSGLLDPRRGRGFFNTFHAHYFFLRFPLDHIFLSPHFKLITLRKEKNFHSDHFPIFVQLQYEDTANREQKDEILKPDEEDKEIAQEKLEAET
ncbi:endonuclease/exonuclease/phosphatase family protein [Sphingobacterium sp. LRF_L2]|uniref:endonuclease/exonuclease/phosphatase family protein n=1 Tax=Sphingobacterium sp. LRF_L2 TaxID=3369421 RepID=UPI003F608730